MIGKDILKAAAYLKEGMLVGMPTETVYGLAGNGLSLSSITSIYQVKDRPAFDPLILHVGNASRIEEFAFVEDEKIRSLMTAFMPGPLTLVLPKRPVVPDLVTSGLPMVAIRVPNHPMALQLLGAVDFPLAAPSANPFGYISPVTAQHVAQQLGEKIPYILDGGAASVGVESTIVQCLDGQFTVLRKGGLPIEDIEKIVGSVSVQTTSSSQPSAPGMLHSHYAPRIPMFMGESQDLMQRFQDKKIGVLAFNTLWDAPKGVPQLVLSPTSELRQAAQNLFSYMRQLDEMDVDVILCSPVPEEGLGRAINDRLRRASRF